MSQSDVNRRDFNKLAAAALGGLAAGAARVSFAAEEKKSDEKPAEAKKEIHVCRGLNSCKGKGGDGKNDCAGQGICATAAKISCAGKNACKNQGGCGEKPGENACKGQGACHVPIMKGAWKKARASLEARLTKEGKKFGAAPPEPAKK